MNTPFGLANLWIEGDAITRFVAIALLTCSIVTWVILLTRFWDLRNLRKLTPELEKFWHATSFEQGIQGFSDHANNPYYQIAKASTEASLHHQSQATNHRELLQTLNYSEWMARSIKNSIDGVSAKLQKGLTFLGQLALPPLSLVSLERFGVSIMPLSRSAVQVALKLIR